MTLSRKSVLVASATSYASICLLPRYAGAVEFVLKCATQVPPQDPQTARTLEAAAKILRDTNGRVEVQVFPNQILGGASALLEQVRVGAIQLYLAAYASA